MPKLIDHELKTRLLASIAGNGLVMLCGAGLSMAPPSSISSAAKVAEHCGTRYREITGCDLPDELAGNLELIAEYFFSRNELEHVLLNQLIDWREFVRRSPNKGHLTVADFLGARVCPLVLSTNLDTLIELAANSLGEPDFVPLVFEADVNLNQPHAPLLKIHGCAVRSRQESVWCGSQLDRNPLKKRIRELVDWMQHYIPNRDLLIVGFWTDWSYLNKVLAKVVASTEPRSVIVVDPSSQDILEAKSPEIWKWATKRGSFTHVQCSGDLFLDELRSCISHYHVWQVRQKGLEIYKDVMRREPPADSAAMFEALSTDELYRLRRDLTGVPSNSVVRQKDADNSQALLGVFHSALVATGACLRSHLFEWNGATLRLINTPGQPLSLVRRLFSEEPPDPTPPQRTICVGAIDDGGAPENLIGRGMPQTIIRNAPSRSWETHTNILAELQAAGGS